MCHRFKSMAHRWRTTGCAAIDRCLGKIAGALGCAIDFHQVRSTDGALAHRGSLLRMDFGAHAHDEFQWIHLNRLHHAVHQITADMALRWNRASPQDLERWARVLHTCAKAMELLAAREGSPPGAEGGKAHPR